MKLSFRLVRCVSVPRNWISGVLGIPEGTDNARLEEELRRQFKVPSRILIWWTAENKAVIGMEALAYDVSEQSVPCGGLCSTDPMEPKDVDRLDGGLWFELDRWGLSVDFADFEYKVYYKLTGQAVEEAK